MQSQLIFSGFTIILKYDTSYIGKVRLFTSKKDGTTNSEDGATNSEDGTIHSEDGAIHKKDATLYCAYFRNLYMGGEEGGHTTKSRPLNDWINEYNKSSSVIVHTSELYDANVCTITEEEYYSSIIKTTFDKKCGNYEDFCHAKKILIDEFCKNEAFRLEEINKNEASRLEEINKNEASRLEEINKNEASRLEEIRTLAIQLAAIIMTYAKAIKY
jgi:hypothetical protein